MVSALAIRWLAVVLMVVDHVGLFLWQDNFGLRVVGRGAFPLFAWLIANGYEYTANKARYLFRLGVFALVSQVPYRLIFGAFGVDDPGWNVFFTLSLGLAAIWIYDRRGQENGWRGRVVAGLGAVGAMVGGEVLKVDYGWRGVALVLAMHIGYKSFVKLIVLAGLVLAWPLIDLGIKWALGMGGVFERVEIVGVFGLAALGVIRMYNHKPGRKDWKWFFYAFYPAHLLAIYFVAKLIYRL